MSNMLFIIFITYTQVDYTKPNHKIRKSNECKAMKSNETSSESVNFEIPSSI